mmetsp:Transcript_4697/g.18792  ORF Transcript_4697/g.18792 Transcript_4697/m.18792 type:complete len:243 (-) Transcript_4697:1642-2370(-)
MALFELVELLLQPVNVRLGLLHLRVGRVHGNLPRCDGSLLLRKVDSLGLELRLQGICGRLLRLLIVLRSLAKRTLEHGRRLAIVRRSLATPLRRLAEGLLGGSVRVLASSKLSVGLLQPGLVPLNCLLRLRGHLLHVRPKLGRQLLEKGPGDLRAPLHLHARAVVRTDDRLDVAAHGPKCHLLGALPVFGLQHELLDVVAVNEHICDNGPLALELPVHRYQLRVGLAIGRDSVRRQDESRHR